MNDIYFSAFLQCGQRLFKNAFDERFCEKSVFSPMLSKQISQVSVPAILHNHELVPGTLDSLVELYYVRVPSKALKTLDLFFIIRKYLFDGDRLLRNGFSRVEPFVDGATIDLFFVRNTQMDFLVENNLS